MFHIELGFQQHSGRWVITPFDGSRLLESPSFRWGSAAALELVRYFEVKYGMEPGNYKEQLAYTWATADHRVPVAESVPPTSRTA